MAVSIAAGIAGGGAAFAIVDATLLQARTGVAEGRELVEVARSLRGVCCDNFSFQDMADMRTGAGSLLALAPFRSATEPVRFGDEGDRLYAAAVGWNYFAVLGTRFALGGGFREEDDRVDAELKAVVSASVWRGRLASRPTIVGETIVLNGRPAIVVGVAEPGFSGHSLVAADAWIPVSQFPRATNRGPELLTDRSIVWLQAVGRLRSGTSAEAARNALSTIHAEAAKRDAPADGLRDVSVVTSSRVPAEVRAPVNLFVGVVSVGVAIVLLLACTNVSALMMARNVDRAVELGVRRALGASGVAIVRQLVIENLLLAIPGAAGGILGALWIARALELARPLLPVPIAVSFGADWRVVAVSLALAVIAALASAVLPTLMVARADVTAVLGGGTRGVARRGRLRGVLVATQVVLATVLLAAAYVLVTSLMAGEQLTADAIAPDLSVVRADLRLLGDDREVRRRAALKALEEIRSGPGVKSAAIAAVVPLSGESLNLGTVRRLGGSDGTTVSPEWNIVSDRYFETSGIAIRRGRGIEQRDAVGREAVVVVNGELAIRLFGSDDPVGQVLVQNASNGPRDLMIVGVAENSKYRSPGEPGRSAAYVSYAQNDSSVVAVLVSARPGESASASVQTQVRRVARDIPVTQFAQLDQIASLSLLPQHLAVWLAVGFASTGLLLAAAGVFGMVRQAVEQRRREIGIRLAIGGTHGDVARSILTGTLWPIVASAGLGVGLASTVPAVLRSFIYGVPDAFLMAPMLSGGAVCVVVFVSFAVPLRAALGRGITDALHQD